MKDPDVFFWILLIGIPNVVLYIVLIAAARLVIRRFRPEKPALAWAVASVASLAMLITLPGNIIEAWRSAALDDTDVTPTRPIRLSGEILIEPVLTSAYEATRGRKPVEPSTGPGGEVFDDYRLTAGCGNVCRALLDTPGVTAVTMDRTDDRADYAPGPGAVRYRIDASRRCDPERDIHVENIFIHEGLFDPPSIHCVMPGRPARRADFVVRDVLVDESDGGGIRSSFEIRLMPRPIGYERLEIADGHGRTLFRTTRSRREPPMLPMIGTGLLLGDGQFVLGIPAPSFFYFEPPGPPAIGVDRVLLQRTNVRRR